MSNLLDPSVYFRAPVISVSSGIALAHALVSACPKSADAKVKKAAKHLGAVADSALEILTIRNKELGVFTEEDSRVLDNEADRAWGALRMRLQAAGMIHESAPHVAKRATALDATLFQGSTDFLKAEYAVQSARMSTILKQIDEDGLGKEIDKLAGPEYLAAVRHVNGRYEKMVEERLKRDTATGQNLSETVRELQAAIVNYATKVIGMVEHDDPKSAEIARLALLPILNHKDGVATREARHQPAPPAQQPQATPSIPAPT